MRQRTIFCLFAFVLGAGTGAAETRTTRTTLDIYVVDVEGGAGATCKPPLSHHY